MYCRLLALILLLTACSDSVETLNFDSDPRILRGKWTGRAVLGGPVDTLAYSPDGSLLFASKAMETAIYDTETFEVITRLELSEDDFDHSPGLDVVRFSADGEVLATASMATDSVYFWNALTGQRLETLHFSGFPVDFSADLNRLATRSYYQEGTTLEVWNLRSENDPTSFTLSSDGDIVLSPDFTHVASLERKGDTYKAVLWDFGTKTKLREFPLNSGSNSGTLLFSPDSALLAMPEGDDSGVAVWDLSANEYLPSDATGGTLLAFSGDGRTLVTRSACDSCISFWDVQTGEKIKDRTFAVLSQGSSTFTFDAQLDQVAWGSSSLKVLDLVSENVLANLPALRTVKIGLDLEATYVDTATYEVAGTLEFDGKTYAAQGSVEGGDFQNYIRTMRSAPKPPSFGIEAFSDSNDVHCTLSGAPPFRQDGLIAIEGEFSCSTLEYIYSSSLTRAP